MGVPYFNDFERGAYGMENGRGTPGLQWSQLFIWEQIEDMTDIHRAAMLNTIPKLSLQKAWCRERPLQLDPSPSPSPQLQLRLTSIFQHCICDCSASFDFNFIHKYVAGCSIVFVRGEHATGRGASPPPQCPPHPRLSLTCKQLADVTKGTQHHAFRVFYAYNLPQREVSNLVQQSNPSSATIRCTASSVRPSRNTTRRSSPR